jgi:hypothetical protein
MRASASKLLARTREFSSMTNFLRSGIDASASEPLRPSSSAAKARCFESGDERSRVRLGKRVLLLISGG